ncbi:hypothetical protein [Brevundimonas sp.]|uniref:hypothetical protein n=1 Tax=Brevundimonas sp. TaxID=1871086 RepID=UPI003D6D7AF8
MATLQPRAVLVTRDTDWERLLAAHATREQARFFLKTRGQDIDDIQRRHEAFVQVVRTVRQAVPDDWRVARVGRADLDRFLFTPEDVIVAVGQDGLVANLSKYLSGQPVLGVNPAPDVNEGVLVTLRPDQTRQALRAVASGDARIQSRTMASAVLDDGQSLTALNEIFVGHRSHQSARYRIEFDGRGEDHSSSGVIIATGTGATGWARSILTATGKKMKLSPVDQRLGFLVREPWPSVATQADLVSGLASAASALIITSRMNDGGVIFADGVEQDHLDFGWGRQVRIAPASATLQLVIGAAS